MNIFRKLLRFLSGRAPVAFKDLIEDAAMFARAGFGPSDMCLLKIDKISAKDPRTVYGLGVKLRAHSTYTVFVASNLGYVVANHIQEDADFYRAVAARVVTDTGEKWIPGHWTWTQLPVDASVRVTPGRPMGCLPDAALYTSQHIEEGYQIVHAAEHAFALKVDPAGHSIWVWPGSGFAPREVHTLKVKEAVEKVLGRSVIGVVYLHLPGK
jgi:hypothetical protein